MLDDEIEKDRERVGRAWRDIVLAFLDQPTQPAETAFGQGHERAFAPDEDDRHQLRPALAESGQQQRRQGHLRLGHPHRARNLKLLRLLRHGQLDAERLLDRLLLVRGLIVDIDPVSRLERRRVERSRARLQPAGLNRIDLQHHGSPERRRDEACGLS